MKILFTLSDLLHQDLIKECERLRITKSEYIRKAIRNELYKEKNPYTPKTPYQSKSLGTPLTEPIVKPENKAVVNITSPEDAIRAVSASLSGEKLCEHGFGFGLCKYGCK